MFSDLCYRLRARLGGFEQVKEQCRDVRGTGLVVAAWNELCVATRALRRTPGLASVAVLSVALGIGATTTVFSVTHAILIDPYPYRNADRIVHLMDLVDARGFAEFQKLDVFDAVVATDAYNMMISGGDLPESVDAARVSSNAFDFFGIPPIAGRMFTAADDRAGQDPERVVVISDAFWRRHYGRDPAALGSTLELDRERYTVIGVAPPRLQWHAADVFLPARLSFFSQPSLEIDARLRVGATREQAEAQALAAMRRVYSRYPPDARPRFRGLNETVSRDVRTTVVLFLVAVFVLLAVGCANVSILLLARATARRHELAMRAAIGASRARLAGHLLAEAIVLTAAGGAAGVALAFGAISVLIRWLPAGTLPVEADIHVNVPVLLLTVATTAAAAICAGLAPMRRFTQPQLEEDLRGSAKRATAPGTRRIQGALVASQVALTVALLAAAGTAVRSLIGLYGTELGFDSANVLRVTVPTIEGAYPTYEGRRAFFEAIRREVASLPDVEAVTYGPFGAPFYGSGQLVDILGMTLPTRPRIWTQFVTHAYFSVFRMPLLRGRTWSEAETTRAANVVVINDTMAKQFWPNGDAIGRKIRMPGLRRGQFTLTASTSTDWLEIVGIVKTIRNRGLHDPPGAAAYVPYTLFIADNQALVARTRTNPLGLVRAVRERIHAAAAGQAIGPERSSVRTGDQIVRANGWEKEEFVTSLFTVFAGLALALATTGLYSAVSYATALRSQEFGIRMALGARAADVVRLVMTPALKTVAAGIAAGLVLTVLSGRLLAHWIGVPGNDLRLLPVTAMILLTVGCFAAIVPARRAAVGDPVAALRKD